MIDLKVLDRHGDPVTADHVFHSGEHETFDRHDRGGLRGYRYGEPSTALPGRRGGVPTLLWKLIEEIVRRSCCPAAHPAAEFGPPIGSRRMEALLAGAFISEGFVSESRAGFNNLDRDYFGMVLAAYDAVVGGPRYVSERTIASGRGLHELDVQNLTALRRSRGWAKCSASGSRQGGPGLVWQSAGRGQACLPAGAVRGRRFVLSLAAQHDPGLVLDSQPSTGRDVQQLLLDFGVISRRTGTPRARYKVVITNRAQAEIVRGAASVSVAPSGASWNAF